MKRDDFQKRFDGVARSMTFQRIIRQFNLAHRKVLDLGCGYGEYLAHFGKGSIGFTTSHEEVKTGTERALDVRFGNVEFLEEYSLPHLIEVVWANNLFEHLLSPHAFLMKLKRRTISDGLLILGVPVIPKIVSLMFLGRFRGSLASNHINFFTKETLSLTVERAGWHVITTRPFWFSSAWLDHVSSQLAPHLYVIAKNDNEFKYPNKKYNEWIADAHYKYLFEVTGQND